MYGIPGLPILPPDMGPNIPSVPMDQPKQLFRYGEQSIWSAQLLTGTVASASFRLFTTPLGQVGQGFTNALSIAETNLKEGGRIPSGVAYDVFGISAQPMQDSAADATGTLNVPIDGTAIGGTSSITNLVSLLNNLVLSWSFTQTEVDIAPLHLVGAGGGVFGTEAITSGTNAAVSGGNLNNGNGSLWLYRKHPVALPGNSTFAILSRFGSRAAAVSATGPVVLRVTLLGYYKNLIEIG